AKMSVGTVHVYVLNPEGHLIDSMHVAQAAQASNLIAMLERDVQKLGTPAGGPVIKPSAPSPPQAEPNTLRLHLIAPYRERKGDDYALIETISGDWSALPSEDWIVLKPEQWTKLLPTADPKMGTIWDVEKGVVTTLLLHFYPPTENSDLNTNRLDEQMLKA